MEFEFSKKADSFQAGIFAILNEKKEEMVKAGKKVYNRRHTGFQAGTSYHGSCFRGGKRSGKL